MRFRVSFPEERGTTKLHQKSRGNFHGDFHARFQEKFHGSNASPLQTLQKRILGWWRILWRFCVLCLANCVSVVWRIFGTCEPDQKQKRGENIWVLKIHSKTHSWNPHRVPGEKCCLQSLVGLLEIDLSAWESERHIAKTTWENTAPKFTENGKKWEISVHA